MGGGWQEGEETEKGGGKGVGRTVTAGEQSAERVEERRECRGRRRSERRAASKAKYHTFTHIPHDIHHLHSTYIHPVLEGTEQHIHPTSQQHRMHIPQDTDGILEARREGRAHEGAGPAGSLCEGAHRWKVAGMRREMRARGGGRVIARRLWCRPRACRRGRAPPGPP